MSHSIAIAHFIQRS